ncbi:hypothetical protein QVD17_35997 [Tagetes erecta]|uniref:Uncharacterized protein n=1 Tax=Tagetes erecta TaxID=13708 RepID=A0AAD8NIL9_TARER|nr:hypothetical protein QVD17_35997 [Tagetes erecta]
MTSNRPPITFLDKTLSAKLGGLGTVHTKVKSPPQPAQVIQYTCDLSTKVGLGRAARGLEYLLGGVGTGHRDVLHSEREIMDLDSNREVSGQPLSSVVYPATVATCLKITKKRMKIMMQMMTTVTVKTLTDDYNDVEQEEICTITSWAQIYGYF